jgi:type I phosphodiesterase/nucleotide pyrophosphatase
MRTTLLRLTCACALACAAMFVVSAQTAPAVTNVLFVTMDGMRWQEVFGGLQAALLTKDEGGLSGGDIERLKARFDAPTPEQRREKLMPFLWTSLARQGQIFGDASRGSVARVTNGLRFSYPGYNEMLTGFPDPRVDSNDRNWNPNVTVLEWLQKRPGFSGRVAAFASWELLPWILNEPRSGVPSNAAGGPFPDAKTDDERTMNDYSADLPRYWSEERFDATTGLGALEYLRTRHPRVLYVMLGETDEWAHGRRYDLYLDAAQRNDRFIRKLWEAAQAIPQYANHTALLIATDHGRGDTGKDWTDHGRDVPASERIWMAAMGPSVAGLGLRGDGEVTQSQIAATIAALLGEDYVGAQPKAAPPLDFRGKR